MHVVYQYCVCLYWLIYGSESVEDLDSVMRVSCKSSSHSLSIGLLSHVLVVIILTQSLIPTQSVLQQPCMYLLSYSVILTKSFLVVLYPAILTQSYISHTQLLSLSNYMYTYSVLVAINTYFTKPIIQLGRPCSRCQRRNMFYCIHYTCKRQFSI